MSISILIFLFLVVMVIQWIHHSNRESGAYDEDDDSIQATEWRRERLFSTWSPDTNVDGTAMFGHVDTNGNAYGVTDSHF